MAARTIVDGDWDNLADADPAADLETLRREIATYREHAPRFSLDDVTPTRAAASSACGGSTRT